MCLRTTNKFLLRHRYLCFDLAAVVLLDVLAYASVCLSGCVGDISSH
jgi:hypothetical protein